MGVSQSIIDELFINLEKRNMKGYFVKNTSQLFQLLEELVPVQSLVGCGDSMTLEEAGVYNYFRDGNFNFLDKYKKGLTSEEKREIYLKNFTADTFITGSNAVTEDGKIFNIDGNGSRVAPMIYGPAQVIIIIGVNKLVPDIEHAIQRARQTAAPLDAIRLNKKTPCTQLKYCIDCKSPERICNSFTAIEGQFIKDRIKVIVIDRDMGY